MNQRDNSFFDRLVDALIDRKHPFWRDERQSAVYHEASTAAMTMQSLLAPVVGGVCMLIGGKPVVGAVLGMLFVGIVCQQIIVGILFRRRVGLDPGAWFKGASRPRKLATAVVFLFYISCYMWVSRTASQFDTTPSNRSILAIAIGLAGGGAVIGALLALYRKKTAALLQAEDDDLQ